MKIIGCLSLLVKICLSGVLLAVGQTSPPLGLPLTSEDRSRIAAIRSQSSPLLTVADVINLATIGDRAVSPDRAHVAVVVNRGNLARNTINSSLLVYRTAELLISPRPLMTFEFASNSNEESAISQLKWVSPNVLSFFGSRPGQAPQVYSVDTRTSELKQLTHSATKIGTFTVTSSGDLVYAADPPASPTDPAVYKKMQARGFALSPTLMIGDMLKGDWQAVAGTSELPKPIIRMVHKGQDRTIMQLPDGPIAFSDSSEYASWSLRFAPAGDIVLTICPINTDPPWWEGRWKAYRDGVLKRSYEAKWKELSSWKIVDLRNGRSRQLMDAPVYFVNTPVLWMPGGRSVVFVDSILPLDSSDPVENAARAKQRMTAEIDLASGKVINVITREPMPLTGFGAVKYWDPRTLTLTLNPQDKTIGKLSFRKTTSGWVKLSTPQEQIPLTTAERAEPQVEVVSSLNEPWKLMTVDPKSQEKRLIFDPNPELLKKHRVAHVTEIHWLTKTGVQFSGELYWPVDYVEGKRYPLFLQTHGRTGGFSPNGFSTTGYAAQPLAAAGMFVLNMSISGENRTEADKSLARDGPLHQEEIEGAIDHLDGLGLIERSKVGLMGFSATCYHVLYTLTHSRYFIAAATVSDGVDMGYFQYLLFGGPTGRATGEFNAKNGGAPVGAQLQAWFVSAPGFNLDHVTTPLLLTAIGKDSGELASVLQEWEPWAGLLQQRKPAELVYIPNGSHELVKPWERFTSQQNNTVDWYRFWLQGYERKEPVTLAGETKDDLEKQYARWRKLREMCDPNASRQKATDAIRTK